MKIKQFEIDGFIKTLKPYYNPILLYGPDEGLITHRSKQIEKAFFKNNPKEISVRKFDNKNAGPLNLDEALQTKSLFSKKETVKNKKKTIKKAVKSEKVSKK